MEYVWKVIVALVVGSFGFGGWVATLQSTVNAQGRDITQVKEQQREDERKYIDVLGRIDERLKNIEKQKTN